MTVEDPIPGPTECWPERSLGVHGLEITPQGAVGRQVLGRTSTWDGAPTAGSLGILVDSVLGHAIIQGGGSWSVSTQISIDVLGQLPAEGAEVEAEGWLAPAPAGSPFAEGRVLDASGAVLARCVQHGRYVAEAPSAEGIAGEGASVPDSFTLQDLLGADLRSSDDGMDLDVTVVPRLQNPLTNLHGGISIAVVELAARAALADSGVTTRTTSIQVTYARAIRAQDRVVFAARVRHQGRTFAVVDVEATVGGRLCVLGRVALDVNA